MRTAMRVSSFCVIVALVLLSAAAAAAETYVIDPDGTGDFPTIQDAVNAATDGDIIELMQGTFTGDGNRDIQVPSRPITIRAEYGGNYMNCQIDCDGSAREEHRGFRFGPEVGTGDATLEGIGIINGYTTGNGGGILVEGADPTIDNCAVAFCTADGSDTKGGGIYITDGADPTILSCMFNGNTAAYGGGLMLDYSRCSCQRSDFVDNQATELGGGVYVSASATSVMFWKCEIVSNSAPTAGGVRMQGDLTELQYCNVSRNEATSGHSGGILLQGGYLLGCTIVENSAPSHGGGVYCDGGTGYLSTCLIAFTEDGLGVAAYPGSEPNLECCNVYGNVDGDYDGNIGNQTGQNDNISVDPELCGIQYADYRLFDTSPCLPANSPCGIQVGAFGQGCDNPVEGVSWGKVKAMWR